MIKRTSAAVVIIALALSGCGHSVPERTLSGAGIGAAAGAVIGAFAGSPATGAAIGAAVGGVTGAVTRPSQVDLGKPIWRQ
jgi:osmotically inducible lipoprotein OsmB